MKTKHLLVRSLTLLLLTALLLTAGCGETPPAGGPAVTTDGAEVADPAGTTGAPETTAPEGTESETDPIPDPNAEYTVSVENGTVKDPSADGIYRGGTVLTLTAVTPPKGYLFSHWENSGGKRVGDTETCTVTVAKNDTFKAYYEVAFGEHGIDPDTLVLTDLSTDWRQGGINGSLNTFNPSDASRISLAEPFLLKKGEVLTVTVPADPWTCPYSGTSNTPCADGCTIAVAKLILKKNAGPETGHLLNDYSFVEKSWAMGGFRYEAQEDVYVMLTVKYDKHGGLPFSVEKPIMKEMQITRTVKAEEQNAPTPVGDYWKPELEDTVTKVEAHRENAKNGLSEFFFITDTHWKDHNAQFSPALVSYLAEELGVFHVVFGGDVIEKNATRLGAINEEVLPFFSAFTDYTKAGERLKILSTLGNHDRNYLSGGPEVPTALTESDVYDLYVARTAGWAVSPEGNPFCSYYDDPVNKVRYLQFAYAANTVNPAEKKLAAVLDWSEEQITSLDGDWTVILFTHGIFEGTHDEFLDRVKDRVLSWQAKADAEIALWITGHTHYDIDEIFVSKDGQTAIRAISLNCDSYGKRGAKTVQMTYGTATEQSFSFLQVDTENETVYLTRVGAGEDLVLHYGSHLDGKYSTAPLHAVRVANGTVNGKYYTRVKDGEWITLKADKAPAGYEFSCWKDLDGNTVGETASLTLKATKSTQYKPFYTDVDPSDDAKPENQVRTDLANDWIHGGTGNTVNEWWLDNTHHNTRTSFAEPLFLKAGQTITVSLPKISCPTGTCAGGCTLATLIAVMDKTGDSETGYLPLEYTVYDQKWTTTFTVTRDSYVTVLVKYNKHGTINFSVLNEEMQDVVITVSP